ncbi:MAG: helix-turn-helix domain-containing protein [Solirubrobacteraceae bacterium]
MTSFEQDPQTVLYSPEQTAQLLGVARGWVYRHADELPIVRLGTGPRAPIRIDQRDLRAWLKASQSGQREQAVIR